MRRIALFSLLAVLLSAVTPAYGVAGPALTVNLNAPTHPISPYIYGMNYANANLAADINLPLNRWGGNDTSRYSYLLDTSSKGMDYFFVNVPYRKVYGDPNRPLPEQSEVEVYIRTNQSWGGDTIITVPMMGFMPKDENFRCGFSRADFPDQTEFDSDGHNCGNGISGYEPDWDPIYITTNDTTKANVTINQSFVTTWVNHLVTRYGAGNAGGVKFYNLDNEPMLWNETHRDVRKTPLGYDELRNLTYTYGAAVKAADPTALTLGPAGYGWEEYFYSAIDWAPGDENAWWNTRTDRMAHGDTPLIEWYLQQMAAYEATNHVRILDYVDEHFYPFFVSLNNDVTGGMDGQRLRATRFLWDPTYNQQPDNWYVEEPFQMIPRMKQWVADNYPGTKTAITEYNFGALNHLNGALAQADVLGIFGREGLDLATLWEPPANHDPGAYAFRMYLDYDGAGADFGDVSVSSASADQGKVSIYGATRTSDGALTLMVINKTGNPQTSTITLTGFTGNSSVDVYRYSDANLNAIQHLANTLISSDQISMDFPANSITLLVGHPSIVPEVNLLTNGSFKSALDSWTAAKPKGDKVKCDALKPNKFAHDGICGLLLTGNSGRTTTFTQNFSASASAGNSLELSVWSKGQGLAASVQLVATATTGVGVQKLKFAVKTGTYAFRPKVKSLVLNGALVSGKFQVVVKSGSGKVYLDDIWLTVLSARGVLPPPDAPLGFRR